MNFYGTHRKLCAGILLFSAMTALPVFANQPGRGSDSEIKSAEGAAVQNKQYDSITHADSFATKNAEDLSRELGTNKQAGRGKPADVRSAQGAAVQNAQRKDSDYNADGVPKSEAPKAFGRNASSPGGMMNRYPDN